MTIICGLHTDRGIYLASDRMAVNSSDRILSRGMRKIIRSHAAHFAVGIAGSIGAINITEEILKSTPNIGVSEFCRTFVAAVRAAGWNPYADEGGGGPPTFDASAVIASATEGLFMMDSTGAHYRVLKGAFAARGSGAEVAAGAAEVALGLKLVELDVLSWAIKAAGTVMSNCGTEADILHISSNT